MRPGKHRVAALASVLFASTLLAFTARADGEDAKPSPMPAESGSAAAPLPPPPPPPPPAPPPPDPVPVAAPPPAKAAAPEEARGDALPRYFGRLVLDDGRVPFIKPKADFVRFDAHGELQVRYENLSRLRLEPPVGDSSLTSLGQRNLLLSWLRLGAQASVGTELKLTLQLDVAPRWVIGDVANGVSAAGPSARDERMPSLAQLRYLFLDWVTPVGLLRVGQMGSHWGMGIVANDGDRPMLFGDYRLGSLVERVAFATKPAGKDSPVTVVVGGDAVYRDNTATWTDGDRAYQAVASVFYDQGHGFLGLYGVRRWQKVASPYDEGSIRVWVVDATARGATPVGSDRTFLFGQAEAATIIGKTNAIRNLEHPEEDIRSYGGAAAIGVVRESARDEMGRTHGLWVVQLEGGYASGDADPNDGVVRRFTFDANHQVGLVMFPFLLHYQTARSATNAAEPSLVARPQPGAHFLASKGGVFAAQYLNPTLVVRPLPTLDLKGGALVAVSTADVVDPYLLALRGGASNYRGGDPKSRDLGLELDLGFEWRIPVPPTLTLQIGGQFGVLFPGHAFDGPGGERMPAMSVAQGRFGVQF